MTLTERIILVLGILLMLRILLSAIKLLQIKGYYKSYKEYLKSPSYAFSEKKPQILKLFKEAGIINFVVPRLHPAGFGQVAKLEIDGFENITYIDPEIVPTIESKFHEAIGVYKHRLFQSFNPIFWIEVIFKLPEFFLTYLGLKAENLIVKIIQVIYWITGIFIGLEELGIIDIIKDN